MRTSTSMALEQRKPELEREQQQHSNMYSTPLPLRRSPKYFADDEWSPLKEVMVGRAEGSCFPRIPLRALANIVPRLYLDEFAIPNNPIPEHIIRKADEELDNFSAVLEDYGVKVRRPAKVDWVKHGGYTGSMLRDGLMVIGNTIIESAFSWPCRRDEIELLHGPMLQEFAEKGIYRVVRAPKPPEHDVIFDVEPEAKWAINNSRIAFDTADFMRLGKCIVTHLSNVTNQKGIDWVRTHLPPGYELIVIEAKSEHEMHIDATLLPLCEGTAIYNPEYVDLKELRKFRPLDTWRLVPPPKKFTTPKYPPHYMATGCLGMNMLVLDGKRVFCYHDDVEMQEFLIRLGMEPIPLPFRHVACLGGSFHCATVDLRREKAE